MPGAVEESMEATPVHDQGSRLRFCQDEPLCIEEAGLIGATSGRSPTFPFPMVTPSPQYPSVGMGANNKAWVDTCQALGLQPHPLEELDAETSSQQQQDMNARVKF